MSDKNLKLEMMFKCHISRVCILLCVFFNSLSFAQTTDSIAGASTDSSAVSAVANDEEPSLDNLSKTGDAINKKLLEEARWEQIKDIIWMVLGFIVVVIVAWYLAAWARKQERKRDDEKARRVEKALQNKPPGASKIRKR